MKNIAIVDCGIGNRAAIRNMLKLLQENPSITRCSWEIENADIIILPGIGSYDSFVSSLEKFDLQDAIKKVALNSKKTILGICIGMQALFDHSEEGIKPGLGLINGAVEHLKKSFPGRNTVKFPHIGWRSLIYQGEKRAEGNEKYYFAHSYHCVPADTSIIHSYFEYEDKEFVSGVRKGNIWGVQFHPEKSHAYGLKFFREFLIHA